MKTQAWGWLTAAVLAAALNSSYHNGGMPWAHEFVDGVGHNTGAVLALATGRADRFLAEARMLNADRIDTEAVSVAPRCPLAEFQDSFERTQSEFDEIQSLSDRQQARLARFEANRVRMQAQINARLARLRIPDAKFAPVVVRVRKIDCPRVRVSVPRIPRIEVPAPAVHVEYSGPGPV